MKILQIYLLILAMFTSGFLVRAQNSVVDIIVNSPNHNTLETAVVAAGLIPALQGAGPFTVFAPTDDAFATLPAGTLSALLADIPALTNVLTYHVVGANALSTDLSFGQSIKTLQGKNVNVVLLNGEVYINNAKVTVADVVADNGVVHVIDAVLLPPVSLPATVAEIISNSAVHNNLDFALSAAGLNDDLQAAGPFTVFAPTDAAFNAIPQDVLGALLSNPAELTRVLLNHVVNGKAMSSSLSDGQKVKTLFGKNAVITINNNGVFINGAKISLVDLEAENGVVHVIDAVLVPTPDVKVVETATKGKVITDAQGRTLYFFARDAKNTSMCTDGCLNNWPVFYAEDLLTGEGLDPADFGKIDRGNGVMQTTYKGWPLYYFVNDTEPGAMNGEGVIGRWFVAKPDYSIMLVDNQLTGLNGVNYKGDYTPGDEVIQYFTDDRGNTLYTRSGDRFNTNRFTRSDFSNNGVWPVYEETEFIVPSILNKADFGVINVHGRNQMTYKGWPLYYFGQDMMVRGSNKGVSVPSPGIWRVPVKDMKSPLYNTVADIVVNSDAHITLEAAVVAAGLVETLQGAGPFTVFAPTDAAFAALPAGTLEALLNDIPALTNILTYHVVGAKAMSTDLNTGQKIVTVQGKEVTVTINDDGVFINNAKVTVANIEADNGVVHVIDAVLLPPTIPATVVDIVVNSADHTTLEAAVVAAGLVETLQGAGPFTVFAPTDAAFAALPAGTVEALLADIPALTNILTYHVVGAKAMSTDLSNGQKIVTVQGKEVTVTINDDGVFINNAKVTIANIEAENGVVHVIDAVLLPPTIPATVVDIVVNSADHTTLEAAVVAAGLVETLQGAGPFTVFAPTDAAFAALPAGTVEALLADIPALSNILTYHVVGAKAMSTDLSTGQKVLTVQGKEVTVTINDEGVFINNAKVTVANIEAENGVVHVIDAVLLPPTIPATVVDIVVNSADHTTLEAAVVAAGLVETLQGAGPFTVFAPTDAAFAALPAETFEALLADIPALTDILTYHVVGAKAMSTDLSNGQKIVTVQGQEVTVTINDDGVFINNAKVTVADIEAENGVVHVIDAVLLPPVVNATFPIDFETKTDAVWEVFANGAGIADDFMVTSNPDKSGINTSGNVLKFKVNDGADPWAGAFSDSYAPFEITANSHIVTMMVWKSVISPVGFKLEASTNGGPVTELKVSNTLTNQWEKITFDLSSLVGYSYNRIVIFPDFPDTRTSGTTVYIDNIEKATSLPATVVDIVVNSDAHNTLEAAVVAAGLVETLQGAGPFTVFAPTDEAFAALPAGTVEALLNDIPALTNILTYHVVGAKAMSTDLSDGQKIVTVQGKEVTVTINNDGVFINNAKVTVADIEAENGVVHVIDAVLIPTTTGISGLKEITMDFYPNPATDYIRINSNVGIESLIIRDVTGRVVTQMNNLSSSERIDLNGFKTGMYLVTMKNGNSVSTKKLIVR